MSQSSRAPRTDVEVDLDYIQILQGVLRRRKKVVVAAFVLIAAPLLGWSIYGQRPQFQSTAIVHIRPSIAEIVPGTRDLPVRSDLPVQMAVLRSRSLTKEVLKSLPQETMDELVQDSRRRDYFLTLSNAARGLLGKPPITVGPRERAMAELQEARMRFRPVDSEDRRGSGLVEISATAHNPRAAMDLANGYIQVLVDWSRRSEQTDTAAAQKFLESQLNQMRTELAQSEAALLKGSTAPPDSPSTSDIRITADAQKLSARLAQLESVLLEMRAKYTEDHPSLVAVRQEIQDLQSELGVVQSQIAPRPKLRPRESDINRLRATVESNRALVSFLAEKLLALRIRGQTFGSDVRIIDPPNVPSEPSEPISPRKLAFLLVFALGGAAGLGFLIEYIYEPVESEKTIRRQVSLPFLGSALQILSGPLKEGGRPVFVFNDSGKATLPRELYRTIRTNLEAAKLQAPFKAIMITSPCPGEGKSTTAINLATTLGELGYRVALVDADLRQPSLSRMLPSGTHHGLTELLQGSQSVDISPDGKGPKRGSEFAFIPSGDLVDDPAAMLSSARAREFVARLKERWDYVLFDSPPLLLVSDNVLFATSLDGVILVAKAGQTARRDLLRAKGMLEERGARILGVILNQVPPGQLPYYHQRYRGYYDSLAPHDGKKR